MLLSIITTFIVDRYSCGFFWKRSPTCSEHEQFEIRPCLLNLYKQQFQQARVEIAIASLRRRKRAENWFLTAVEKAKPSMSDSFHISMTDTRAYTGEGKRMRVPVSFNLLLKLPYYNIINAKVALCVYLSICYAFTHKPLYRF